MRRDGCCAHEIDCVGGPHRRLLHQAGVLLDDGRLSAPRPAASRLNRSGSPVQLCVSASLDGRSCISRLIVDPFPELPASERAHKALSFAAKVLGRAEQDLVRALPDRLEHEAGPLWIALPAGWDDAVVYLNARLYDPQAWAAIRDRLGRLLPPHTDRVCVLTEIAEAACPVSLGLSFASGSLTGVRLYVRAATPDFLRRLTRAGQMPRLDLLLRALGGTGAWPGTGLTWSIGFSARTGGLDGIKADFCLCPDCLVSARVAPSWTDSLAELAPRASGVLSRWRPALAGIGAGARGARLNLYFDPCAR